MYYTYEKQIKSAHKAINPNHIKGDGDFCWPKVYVGMCVSTFS